MKEQHQKIMTKFVRLIRSSDLSSIIDLFDTEFGAGYFTIFSDNGFTLS